MEKDVVKDIEFLEEMFPIEKDVIYDIFISSKKNMDETISSLESLCKHTPNNPPSYEEALANSVTASIRNSSDVCKSTKRRDSKRFSAKKEWTPPILGKLPDDFLKVSSEILKISTSSDNICKGCRRLRKTRSVEITDSFSLGSAYSSMNASNMGDMDSIIRRRMADNVNQTRNVSRLGNDDSDYQYLDDERLALMLQNQEFREVVKSDPEFQQAFEEDCRSVAGVNPANAWAEVEESVCFRPQDDQLNYGYERSSIVDPDCVWPDHPQIHGNPEASKIVKSLGNASRKRLSSIAKLFSVNKRNKTPKKYIDSSFDDINPPMRRSCWEDESVDELSAMDSVSCVGDRYKSFRQPLSAVSERSS